MKRGFLAACLIVMFFPTSVYAASPLFERALTSVLTEGKPSNFTGTVHVTRADSDVVLKFRGAGEKGKVPKMWIALDITGTVEDQMIDLSIEMRFKNGKTYIRVDEVRPDVFFSHWKGVKGQWYVLPVSLSLHDITRILPQSGNAADIASMVDVTVTRFSEGRSFTFFMPSFSGKIDSTLENDYRFFSGKYSFSDGDKTMTADFKAQRQFVSVYVETPKGTLVAFPVGTLDQNAFLRAIGADAMTDKLPADEPVAVVTPVPNVVTPVPTQKRPVRTRRIGRLSRVPFDRVSPATDTTDRFVSDREALRNRKNLNVAPLTSVNVTVVTGDETFIAFATAIAMKFRGADVKSVIASGTAATVPMKSLFSILKSAELTDPTISYAYLVAPTSGTDSFKLLVDNYTLLSSDLLDLNRNGTVDTDEQPVVPGTVYSNALFTKALQSPIVETENGVTTAYVPVKDGEGNVIAVLAVSESAR